MGDTTENNSIARGHTFNWKTLGVSGSGGIEWAIEGEQAIGGRVCF